MKKKRAPWPRWAKVARNILLTALLALLAWDMWGWPSLSFRADLRRAERRMLIPEPETVVELKLSYGNPYRIELSGDVAVMAMYARGSLFSNAYPTRYVLGEGPALLCVPFPVVSPDEAGQPLGCAAYVAVQPPEGSASAVLTLHNEDGNFTAEGVPEERSFLFYARPQPDRDGYVSMGESWFRPEMFTYELAFYDMEGRILQEISG